MHSVGRDTFLPTLTNPLHAFSSSGLIQEELSTLPRKPSLKVTQLDTGHNSNLTIQQAYNTSASLIVEGTSIKPKVQWASPISQSRTISPGAYTQQPMQTDISIISSQLAPPKEKLAAPSTSPYLAFTNHPTALEHNVSTSQRERSFIPSPLAPTSQPRVILLQKPISKLPSTHPVVPDPILCNNLRHMRLDDPLLLSYPKRRDAAVQAQLCCNGVKGSDGSGVREFGEHKGEHMVVEGRRPLKQSITNTNTNHSKVRSSTSRETTAITAQLQTISNPSKECHLSTEISGPPGSTLNCTFVPPLRTGKRKRDDHESYDNCPQRSRQTKPMTLATTITGASELSTHAYLLETYKADPASSRRLIALLDRIDARKMGMSKQVLEQSRLANNIRVLLKHHRAARRDPDTRRKMKDLLKFWVTRFLGQRSSL